MGRHFVCSPQQREQFFSFAIFVWPFVARLPEVGQENIGGGETVQSFFVLSGISRELHEIAAGVTPSTLTRWFSSRFVRLNCRKYKKRANALRAQSFARRLSVWSSDQTFPIFASSWR